MNKILRNRAKKRCSKINWNKIFKNGILSKYKLEKILN